MISRSRAVFLRRMIEKASASLTDVEACEAAELFPRWSGDSVEYQAGDNPDRVSYNGTLYKCLTGHTSQPTWTPSDSPSIWVRVDDPSQEWPEWVQPLGSTDAYRIDDKVSHNDKHWVSTLDYNTYEPGVYGWSEVT